MPIITYCCHLHNGQNIACTHFCNPCEHRFSHTWTAHVKQSPLTEIVKRCSTKLLHLGRRDDCFCPSQHPILYWPKKNRCIISSTLEHPEHPRSMCILNCSTALQMQQQFNHPTHKAQFHGCTKNNRKTNKTSLDTGTTHRGQYC